MLGCVWLPAPAVMRLRGLYTYTQVATDALVQMEAAMSRDKVHTNDRQLACARIHSAEGRDYLAAMAAAANYAFVNRSSMTFLARQAFAKQFDATPDDLDMHVVYDVSHNIAKVNQYTHPTSSRNWCLTALCHAFRLNNIW